METLPVLSSLANSRLSGIEMSQLKSIDKFEMQNKNIKMVKQYKSLHWLDKKS
jgi:hypothetical protein